MSACSLQGCSGQNETQNRPGAGCPEQSSTDAKQEGVQDTCTRIGVSGKPVAQLHQRARQTIRQRREKQGKAKHRKENQSGDTAELIGSYRPASAHGRQAGNQGKRDRHTGKQRQTTLAEGLIGARKHKWQHRQDAGAENGEHPTEIR